MSSGCHRRTAWLAGFAYLLASTLSGLWHSHAGEHGSAGCHPCDNHAADSDSCEHIGGMPWGESIADAAPAPCAPTDDDACSICRFVGQSALADLPLPVAARPEAVAAVRSRLPLVLRAMPIWHGLARAPPTMA